MKVSNSVTAVTITGMILSIWILNEYTLPLPDLIGLTNKLFAQIYTMKQCVFILIIVHHQGHSDNDVRGWICILQELKTDLLSFAHFTITLFF